MYGQNILEILKNEVSKQEYQQYISKIIFDSQSSNSKKFIFIAPNAFIANWAKRNYTDKIHQILKVKTPDEIQIQFTTKTTQENTTKAISTKKYNVTNNQTLINAHYTFENFVVGNSNKLAYETAREVVQSKGVWNPLVIYGNTGLGKSHLLYSICNAVYKKTPNANIAFIRAEDMMNDYSERIKTNTMNQFRERFRQCDYLLIDDIQFLANTDKFQEEFFNTYNAVVENNGQIVMTSDKSPKLINKLEERLKSRFLGGMMAPVKSLELETKRNIIKQKCLVENITLAPDIIDLIATQIQDNARELEGIITDLKAQVAIFQTQITQNVVKDLLKDRATAQHTISFDDIMSLIAREYNIKPSEIKTKTRGKKVIAKARKIVAYIARETINTTLPYIATELHLKDHSAVSKQIKSIMQSMQEDNNLKIEVENLIAKLKQKAE